MRGACRCLVSSPAALERQPAIGVPTIALWGADDGVTPVPRTDRQRDRFSSFYERRIVHGAGHNLPQEAPEAVLSALQDLLALPAGVGTPP